MRKFVPIFVSAIAIFVLYLVFDSDDSANVINPLASESDPFAGGSANQVVPEKRNHDDVRALPEKLKNTSLKGTTIDGLYPVDEQGNLLLSKDIKNRFEYFLSTMGEFPLEQVLDMIKEDIALNLVSPAKEQALKLFDDYVAYKYALSELEASLSAPEDYEINDIERMRAQLQQMRDVRRNYLDVEAVDAFFGFDEMYDDFMLARLEIQNNRQLTDEEKAAQLSGLEQGLPQDVQDMRNETQRVSQVFQLTQEIKESGGTAEDVYKINEQEFGQEAAQRLQLLDQQRDEWQSRVNIYISQKQGIEADENLTEAEKLAAVSELKASTFEASEYHKLSAYELMAKEAEAQ